MRILCLSLMGWALSNIAFAQETKPAKSMFTAFQESQFRAVPMAFVPGFNLKDALQLIQEQTKARGTQVNLLVNVTAFKAEALLGDDASVLETGIHFPKVSEITSLRTALRKYVVPQLPVHLSNATFLLRKDHIEILPQKQAHARLQTLDASDYFKKPLQHVLDDMATQTGISIVLDPHSGKANLPITMKFPALAKFVTAVGAVAELAGLKAHVDEAVIYVGKDPAAAFRAVAGKPSGLKLSELVAAQAMRTKDKLPLMLNESISTSIFSDVTELTLKDGLDLVYNMFLSKGKSAPFLVDVAAFKAEAPTDAPPIFETKIQFPREPRTMTVRKTLEVIVSQLPEKNGAFIVRPEYIEITTRYLARPKYQKIEALEYRRKSLDYVLDDLAAHTGVPILLDPRCDRAKTLIDIRFLANVDIVTAVRVVADTAGLKVHFDGKHITVFNGDAPKNEK